MVPKTKVPKTQESFRVPPLARGDEMAERAGAAGPGPGRPEEREEWRAAVRRELEQEGASSAHHLELESIFLKLTSQEAA